MGLIFSRYRRKKGSDEILEEIQSSIQFLESDRDLALQRQNYLVGRLIIYSVILYVIAAALFYFCFFPASLTDRMFYMIPLLMFPLLVVLLKKFITWYYKREINQNKDKLAELKAKKKKILEDVMDKETYKVAKEILEKYAPEQLKKPETNLKTLPTSLQRLPPSESKSPPHGGPQLQQQLQAARVTVLPTQQLPPAGFSPVHHDPVSPMVLQRWQSSPQRIFPSEGGQLVIPQRRLVRPIIPRERNFIDRVIEFIIGDGPSNRYALICKNCASHNGMALREELEYVAFRCAYCDFPHPSHRVRPAVSRPHSRSSSEERGGLIEESKEKFADRSDAVDTTEVKEEKDDTSLSTEDRSHSNGDPDLLDQSTEAQTVDASKTEAESDESSSTPYDGVRPRKPLQLTD